jgi:hypothetical protein
VKIRKSKPKPEPKKAKKKRRKMRKGGGAAKGSRYERELCKRFSFWFSDGESEDLFWRTSGSGSRATNRRRLGKNPSKFDFGDMKHETEKGKPLVEHLCWEFRSRARFDLFAVFGSGVEDPKTSLLASWAKACYEADCSGRRPILITKALQRQDVLWMPYGLFIEIMDLYSSETKGSIHSVVFLVPGGMTVRYEGKKTYTFEAQQRVVGVSLVDWIFGMDPEEFMSCLERWMMR